MTEQEYISQVAKLLEENQRLKAMLGASSENISGNALFKEACNENIRKLTEESLEYQRIQKKHRYKLITAVGNLKIKLKAFLKRRKSFYKFALITYAVLKSGPKSALKRFCRTLGPAQKYYTISKEQREKEESRQFDRDVKFSVLVPLYNTPLKFLDEMIFSVTGQTYKNLELCLADGSDDAHSEVGERVRELQKADPRIVYKKLEKNMGISENTNACIDMATGDYIALFDHDDVLHPSALYENMIAICEHGADFIYTDEAVFESSSRTNITSYHHKGDYSPDALRANNYICHFSVFSRELLEKAGRFNKEYDGSQDHDIILRLTEKAQKVYHIRKVLYFWRSHSASVASDISSKPYCILSGRRAVHDSVVRTTGRECVVTSSKAYPTIYDIKYELREMPVISVVVSVKNGIESLKKAMGLMMLSSYTNLEMIVVTDSKNEEIAEFLKKDETAVKLVDDCNEEDPGKRANLGARAATGKYIVFLDECCDAASVDWIEQMLMFAQREDVGAVGAKLFTADAIHHCGIIIGAGEDGITGRENYNVSVKSDGYVGRIAFSRNTSAVSGECMMISRALFEALGGFDVEMGNELYAVDLCLRLREKGLLNVYASLAQLRFKGALPVKTEEGKKRFVERWEDVLKKGDPYYNPNFSQEKLDYRLK